MPFQKQLINGPPRKSNNTISLLLYSLSCFSIHQFTATKLLPTLQSLIVDFGVLYGFLETNQTNYKKPVVWRNHTKAKGWKKPGPIIPDYNLNVPYVNHHGVQWKRRQKRRNAIRLFSYHDHFSLFSTS